MAKKQRMATAVLLVAVLGGFAWEVLRLREGPEPVYQGKPLRLWLETYDTPGFIANGPEWQKADEAVRQIGTNAVPALLRMLCKKDSPLALKFIALAQKQQFIKIRHIPAVTLNYQAAVGFQSLGSEAKDAIPALVEIYERNISRQSQRATAEILGSLGPVAKQAIPALLRGATNAEFAARLDAVTTLGQIHAEPKVVIPALIKSLGDSNALVRNAASSSLGSFGPEAKAAVPALLRMLSDKNPFVTANVTNSLKQIDPETAA